jgi:predicted ATPase
VRAAARTFLEIIREENKRFLVSTHSEAFLSALLAEVARGELSPSDFACYFVHKDKRISAFERQEVNAKGQVTGGLKSFIEGELADVQAFLNPSTAGNA